MKHYVFIKRFLERSDSKLSDCKSLMAVEDEGISPFFSRDITSFICRALRGNAWRIALFMLVLAAGEAQGEGLFNLPDKPSAPRFAITEPIWPSRTGEAVICLWEDDKIACLSFFINEGSPGLMKQWLAIADDYKVRFTWPISTSLVGARGECDWGLLQEVKSFGHGVESQAVSSWNVTDANWKDLEWEYSESLKMIEANMPGNRVHYLMYRGWKTHPNDPKLAAKYYLAAAGPGKDFNKANELDYLNLLDTSHSNLGDKPEAKAMDLNRILAKGELYRGWAIIVCGGKPNEGTLKVMEWYKNNEQQLWAGLFGDVARYGQERDTATLKTVKTDGSRISLMLTDKMDPAFYDYPLTIKIRLDPSWTGAQAMQNGKLVPCRILAHEGINYALVKAAPNQGEIVLGPTAK